MATSSVSPTAQQASPGLSEAQRLLNTFIAPAKTFNDLKRKPSWWMPWLIIALLSVAFAYLIDRKVGYDQVVETALKMTPKRAEQLDRLPPDQRRQQLAMAEKITAGIVYCTPLTVLLIAALMALVLMVTFNFVTGSEISFRLSMAALFYAWLPPSVVKTLIVIAALMAPGFAPEGFNIEHPTATSLAALMAFPPASPALYKLAAGIDLFSIWTVVLVGIGFSCVGNVKRPTAILIVAVWYAVVVLMGAGWAALGA